MGLSMYSQDQDVMLLVLISQLFYPLDHTAMLR